MFCNENTLSYNEQASPFTLSMDLPDAEAWFKCLYLVNLSKNIKMHNCCFLTILSELTFLLYPLDTRCVLNLVLKSVFFLCSMNGLFRYIIGPLAVIYLIKNERNCHVLMMPFHHSKRHNSACQQKKAVEDKRIVRKLCERRKKTGQYLSVQIALNSVRYMELTLHSLGFVRDRI